MAIHSSGPISFQDLVDEFNTGKPISLSQMYAGAGYVPTANAGVPINGPISLGDFYGATAAYVLNYNITADMLNFNSTTILSNSSWNWILPVVLTINISSGIVVSGDNVNTPAFLINALPSGSQVILNNNGYIIGMGGRGGSYPAQPGEKGGDAIQVSSGVAVSIKNLGTIAGGGGGGAGVGISRTSNGGGGGQSGRVNASGGSAASGRTGGTGTFTNPGSPGGNGAGTGGTWGNAGSNGTAAGGAGGKAVVGNSYITWIAVGTRNGAVT